MAANAATLVRRYVLDALLSAKTDRLLSKFLQRHDYRALPLAYVTFEGKSDGAISLLDSGQTRADLGGYGLAPTIVNGRLVAPNQNPGAMYFQTPNLGAPVTRVGGYFSMQPQAGQTDAGTACIAITNAVLSNAALANGASNPFRMALHYLTTRSQWYVTVWDSSTSGQQVIDTGYYDEYLPSDGTEVKIEAWIQGTKLTVDLPNGQRKTYTDARFASFAGNFAFCESYKPNAATDDMIAWSSFWADTKAAIPTASGIVRQSGGQRIDGQKRFELPPFAPAPYAGGQLVNRDYADARYMVHAGVWDTEGVLNGAALASGYNDLIGGMQVNNPYSVNGILLDSVSVRLGDPAAVVGTGDLTIQHYLGSPTSAEMTLVATSVIAANGHDIITTLATPVQCAHNSVLRAKVVLGTAVVNGPVHVQYRGRYV